MKTWLQTFPFLFATEVWDNLFILSVQLGLDRRNREILFWAESPELAFLTWSPINTYTRRDSKILGMLVEFKRKMLKADIQLWNNIYSKSIFDADGPLSQRRYGVHFNCICRTETACLIYYCYFCLCQLILCIYLIRSVIYCQSKRNIMRDKT